MLIVCNVNPEKVFSVFRCQKHPIVDFLFYNADRVAVQDITKTIFGLFAFRINRDCFHNNSHKLLFKTLKNLFPGLDFTLGNSFGVLLFL
jgi:hypothetical protein